MYVHETTTKIFIRNGCVVAKSIQFARTNKITANWLSLAFVLFPDGISAPFSILPCRMLVIQFGVAKKAPTENEIRLYWVIGSFLVDFSYSGAGIVFFLRLIWLHSIENNRNLIWEKARSWHTHKSGKCYKREICLIVITKPIVTKSSEVTKCIQHEPWHFSFCDPWHFHKGNISSFTISLPHVKSCKLAVRKISLWTAGCHNY